MPSVNYVGIHVNSSDPGQLQSQYAAFIASLRPADLPCIHCFYLLTHGHGYYPRTVYFEECGESFRAHRRHCPVCKRTFGILPEIVAPYQRVSVVVQENVVKRLASGMTYAKASQSIPSALGPISTSTLKRWYERATQQVSDISARFAALVLSQQPDVRLPTIPLTVRDRTVCFFYVLGEKWQAAVESCTSAAWNVKRIAVCLFAPLVSVNRVSYALSPDLPP